MIKINLVNISYDNYYPKLSFQILQLLINAFIFLIETLILFNGGVVGQIITPIYNKLAELS